MKWECLLNVRKIQSKQSVTGGGGHFYTDTKKRMYVAQLAGMLKDMWEKTGLETPFTGPTECEILLFFSLPKSASKKRKAAQIEWKDTRPDTTNLCKPVEDAITMAGIVSDDAIFCKSKTSKFYYYGSPKIIIRISSLSPVKFDTIFINETLSIIQEERKE